MKSSGINWRIADLVPPCDGKLPGAAQSKTEAERIAALRQALEQIRAHAYAMTTSQIEATAATALRVDERKERKVKCARCGKQGPYAFVPGVFFCSLDCAD